MLAAPIVALVDPGLIPGTLIMSAIVVTLLVLARERTSLDLRGAGWALAGRVPGTLAGAVLLVVLPEQSLALMLAFVVLCGAVTASFGWQPDPQPRNLAVAGAASGLLGTATSIGGPPMALVLQRTTGAKLRATMSTFFLVGSIMSLVALTATGSLDRANAVAFVMLLPPTVLGFLASRYVNGRLNSRRLRQISIAVSCLGAALLIGRQLAVMLLY